MPPHIARSAEEKVRVHIWMAKDDVEEIRSLYGESIGFSRAVQLMVRTTLKQIRAKAAREGGAIALQGDEVPEPEAEREDSVHTFASTPAP